MDNPQIVSEGELYHYGRKGMKWYQNIFSKNKKNGSKKRSEDNGEEDVEAKKQKILSSRSAKELYDNADLFTTQELQAAYNRLQLERNIASLQPKEVDKGKQFLTEATDWGRKINDLADVGIKGYNNVAKVYNTFSKEGKENPIPIIKGDDGGDKKKEKKIDLGSIKKEKKDKQPTDDKDTKDSQTDDSKTTDSGSKKSESSDKTETWEGTVEGKGTSRYKEKEGPVVDDPEWREADGDTPVSNLPSVYVSTGKDFVDDLLK